MRASLLSRAGRAASLLALLLTAPALTASAAERPNIVVVMVDDMGYSDIGCYGSEIETPQLDALAASGLRYSQFYNTCRCCPTRASLLTGLYSHRAGIGHMDGDYGQPGYQGRLNDRCATLAELLRPAGYRTYMSGKWHVGTQRGHWPLDRGFERFYGSPIAPGHHFRVNPGRPPLQLDGETVEAGDDWYSTDAFTDYAIDFLKDHDQEQPFYLYLAYTAPHWPLHALPSDIAKYRDTYRVGWDAIRRQRHAQLVKLGLLDASADLSPRDNESIPWKQEQQKDEMALRMAIHAAMIDRVDQNIGRLVETLRKMDAFDNTLFLFLSDNGASAEAGQKGFSRGKPGAESGTPDSYVSFGASGANLSCAPFRRFKRFVHEGGIATPLIVHWPAGLPKERNGTIDHQPGHVIDLVPTCLAAAGVKYPTEHDGHALHPLDGVSLLPSFQGETLAERPLYFEHEGNRAIRVGRWKAVSPHKRPWELYDLQTDRTELHNLAKEHPERLTNLAAQWQTWADAAGVLPWPVKRGK